MRIVTWNIRNPSAVRVPQIAEAVSELRPDVVVLTEYTDQASELQTRLSDSGLTGWVTSKPKRPLLGVAIASRGSITSRPTSDPCPPWAGVLAVEVEGLHIVGLHGPGKKSHLGESKEPIKRRWWSGLLDECDRWRAEPTVIIGDFNNGTNSVDAPGNAFVHSDLFDALPAHGFQDGWRGIHGNAQDHSFEAWYGWRRLDHIFHSGVDPVSRTVVVGC